VNVVKKLFVLGYKKKEAGAMSNGSINQIFLDLRKSGYQYHSEN